MTFISIAKLFCTMRMTQIFYFILMPPQIINGLPLSLAHTLRQKRALLQPGGSPIKWVLFKVTACLVLNISLLSWISKGRNKPVINFVVGTYFPSLFASFLHTHSNVICDLLLVLCAPSCKSFIHTLTNERHYQCSAIPHECHADVAWHQFSLLCLYAKTTQQESSWIQNSVRCCIACSAAAAAAAAATTTHKSLHLLILLQRLNQRPRFNCKPVFQFNNNSRTLPACSSESVVDTPHALLLHHRPPPAVW